MFQICLVQGIFELRNIMNRGKRNIICKFIDVTH